MIAVRDVLSYPVRLLVELPRAVTLVVVLPLVTSGADAAGPTPVLLTTSRARAEAAALASPPALCLTPLEYEALAVALEVEACSREDVLHALERKRADTSHRVTLAGLVGAARGRDGRLVICPVEKRPLLRVAEAGRVAAGRGGPDGRTGPTWTVGQLVAALGGELVGVEVEGAELVGVEVEGAGADGAADASEAA